MADESQRRTIGGCMCGAVRFEALGEPIIVTHCHCNSCRRHTGAPLVTLVSFEAGQVRFTKGERKIYNSSPGVGRAFCGDCGTTLTWESDPRGQSLIEFHIGTLDEPNALPPRSTRSTANGCHGSTRPTFWPVTIPAGTVRSPTATRRLTT